jgi:hypothetical protein
METDTMPKSEEEVEKLYQPVKPLSGGKMKKSGVNERPSTPKQNIKPPAQKPPEQPKVTPMTATERREIKTLIEKRSSSLISSLGDELSGKPELIKERIKIEKGVRFDPEQLKSMIGSVNDQIKEIVGEHIENEQEKHRAAESDIEEEYDRLEEQLKKRHSEEWNKMMDEKSAKTKGLKEKARNIEKDIINQQCKELGDKRASYQLELVKARELESEIEALTSQRLSSIKHNKGRLISLIRDKTNNALERLYTTDNRKEARDLITGIPTIAEAIGMCQTLEGIDGLFKRLDPSRMLPGPMEDESSKLKNVNAVDASIVTGEENNYDGEEEEEDRDDWRRQRDVYRRRP